MEENDRAGAELKKITADRYNEGIRSLHPIRIDTPVRIQDPNSRLWDKAGIIVSKGKHRDYRVKQPSGRILWRTTRFLREHVTQLDMNPRWPLVQEACALPLTDNELTWLHW